jgi:hypothetical protein
MRIVPIYQTASLCVLGLLLSACGATKKQQDVSVSPPVVPQLNVTGSYTMTGAPSKEGEESGDTSGMMLVRQDQGEAYEIALIINRGAPSYHSGEIKATLDLQEGKMRYSALSEDKMNCVIDFYFDEKGVEVTQDLDMEKPNCEFGYGVTAMGYFEKTSSATPVIPSGPLGEQ